MPSLGPDMESGTLVEWRVKPGDLVKRGDVVALVETDKGVIDVEVFAAGTVEKLLVEPGARVPVGTPLAQLSGTSPAQTRDLSSRRTETNLPLPPGEGLGEGAPATPSGQALGATAGEPAHGARPRVSPAARTRARALGIDLSSIVGTGPGGVVTLDDVLKHAPASVPVAARAVVRPALEQSQDMRRVIARAMSRSKREIPHYYLSLTCSLLKARAWMEQYNATVSIEQRLLPSALLLKAVALAARAMPEFNGFYVNEEFSPAADVNVGMAIAMRGGRLVAPAILNADQKTLPVVMAELRDLATRVRAGRMRSSELALPTITVTSLAEEGVDLIVPAIYPPQVAIVGFGAIVERPWVIEGDVRAAPLITVSLAADHRVTDGRAGARFITHIRDSLQTPETL
jgi:pyruvate dehydrogenase E2 component (dihydrolipoamide acetyltransferase)